MNNKIINWSKKQIAEGKNVKRILSPFEVSRGSLEFDKHQKTFHIIDSTSDSLKSLMGGNGRLSGYHAAQYLRMTDKIPAEFRPLIAIIEAYDIPRMKLGKDNVCIGGINAALQYAEDNNIINIEEFLIGLKDYFIRLVELNKKNPAMEYFVDQIEKGIKFIDSQLI